MIVKNGETTNIASPSLERSLQFHEIGSATEIANSNATRVSVPVNDQIALSLATKFLLQAANAGGEVRLERIRPEDGDHKGPVSVQFTRGGSCPG